MFILATFRVQLKTTSFITIVLLTCNEVLSLHNKTYKTELLCNIHLDYLFNLNTMQIRLTSSLYKFKNLLYNSRLHSHLLECAVPCKRAECTSACNRTAPASSEHAPCCTSRRNRTSTRRRRTPQLDCRLF